MKIMVYKQQQQQQSTDFLLVHNIDRNEEIWFIKKCEATKSLKSIRCC